MQIASRRDVWDNVAALEERDIRRAKIASVQRRRIRRAAPGWDPITTPVTT